MTKWIISDVDGCISPEESVAWDSERFLELTRMIQDASAGRNGLAPLTLCTGRPQPYVEVLMKILDVRAPAICENGAVLYTLSSNMAEYGPEVTAEKITGLRAVRIFIETEILPDFPEAVLQYGKEAQLSVYSEKPELFPQIQRRIEAFVAERGGPELHLTCSHFYLNISLDGVDKGQALRELLQRLGVAREDVAGIGDTPGDLPLRENVGFFACPANATDGIKAVADYVSPYPTIEGMLDILKRPEFRKA